jgi:hypothetical protein
MSLAEAEREIAATLDELWFVVCELVVTVHEDRPVGSDLAVVDDLAERVSELQGGVNEARELAQRVDPVTRPQQLDGIASVLARTETYFWRELRAHTPVAHLRAAARSRGPEWQAWRRSVEEATSRCEEPLENAGKAVRHAWHEVGELVSLGVGRPSFVPIDPHDTHPSSDSESPRRSS